MRYRLALVLLIVVSAVLVAVSSARADGQVFIVTGTADGAGSCGGYPGIPGYFACTTLRGAVNAAGANDVIGLPSGTYTLSQGELAIPRNLNLVGGNAHDTIINGSGTARVLSVGAGISASLNGLTITGGRAGAQNGGNILNDGSLLLFNTRVTNGIAALGGGIAGSGELIVASSLIDANTATSQGGGIASFGGDVSLGDSTVFGNHANTVAGIYWVGSGGTPVTLSHVTMAFNTTSGQNAGGLSVAGGTWNAYGSLFIGNQGDGLNNCATTANVGSAFNIEDGTSCGFAASNVSNTGLANTLSDQGGHTPVLAIPGSGPAKGSVNPCQSGLDQRDAPRNASGACDAGAYEQGVAAPPVTGFQIPTVPTPTPTATPTATPVAGKSVAGTVVKGKVRVKAPGGKFVDLDPSQPIPLGSTIDTKAGTIQLSAQQTAGAKPQTGKFFDGVFKITQTKKTTDLTLNEALAKCPKKGAHAAAKKPKTRKLWGDGSGSFRTRGQYSAATVRGTIWLMQDSCAGTLTQVKKGAVTVRDNVKNKTIVLRAPKKYLAKPKKR